ncbi:nicotinate phosphoribosyltransferase [Streptomyces tropicalis]|uniref:Nicotinate phosphoribosyltransferase n=1 Tax=Streptomyces tropicalis TaxID=3034234 RepID=A0ABT6AA22_9ACTN|nr:nicotinate phosphoribosyltransferase [Streptomyces tropicalis]MDF3301493.1 nicotinate phosphoribosyltransferase [Streptomyces tropicalis]
MSDVTTTDLYEVTMALSYLREGMDRPATFSLFVRDLPDERGFLVSAGLEAALDFLEGFRVSPGDVRDFAAALGRPAADLGALEGLRFTGEVRAVPEGRAVFAGEPLLEVTAPLPEAQMVETFLLNQVSHQTAVAAKAARCVLASRGRPVVDFSLRRTHGRDAGLQAARVSALAGFAGTSDVAAAVRWALPASGTMAHSYVEAFPDEESAFRAFARAHPGPVTFLVDTYDTLRGTATAARVLRDLGPPAGSGVRLDSGDLGALARGARQVLDAQGLTQVRIIASGGLDEYRVDDLVRSGAPIDVFAVGTRVGTAADAPYLDSAYKLVEYDGNPVMKLSSAKATAPGRKQVHRRPGQPDLVALRDEPAPPDTEPLLRTVMRAGRRVGPPDTLAAARARLRADLGALPGAALRIRGPRPPRPGVSRGLARATAALGERLRARYGPVPAGPGAGAATGSPAGTVPSGRAAWT